MAPLPSQRLWTADYFRAFIVHLGVSMVFITLMSFMALYAAERFSVNDTAAGFAASAFVAGGALARVLIGKYLDFLGRKRTLVFVLLVFVACALLYPVTDHYVVLLLVRIIHGAAFGVASTTITSIAITLVPAVRLGEGLGYMALAATLSNAIGPLAALQLHERASNLWVFGFTLVCTLFALIAALFMTVRERTPTEDEYRRRWRIRGSDLVDPRVLPIAVVGLLTTLGYSVIMTFLPAYLVGLDMVNIASLFFLIWALAMLIVRLFAGRLHDRYGDNAVIPGALISLTAGLVILALASADWHFIIAAILGGFGHGAALPGIQTAGIKRTTSHRVPIATSTHYLALDSGLAIGPVMLGFIIHMAGYSVLYFAGAGIVALGLLVYWLGHGRRAAHAATS
ncbi:MFS transporter [Yaniella halotolerans]|uniref:MFS transporter n=1 Tax=Yaniella halotolerans TaxID=225453 RepID=UPI0003B717BF|nr:MFS transporter [Yaniella halotolerans]